MVVFDNYLDGFLLWKQILKAGFLSFSFGNLAQGLLEVFEDDLEAPKLGVGVIQLLL